MPGASLLTRRCDRARGARHDPSDGNGREIAEQLFDPVPNRIELVRSEGADRAAALARDELPLAAADQRLEAGPMSEVDMAREPVLLERLEIAVDRGELKAQAAPDVLGRYRTVGREQGLQHQPTGGGQSESSRAKRLDGIGEIGEGQPRGIGSNGHDYISSCIAANMYAIPSVIANIDARRSR